MSTNRMTAAEAVMLCRFAKACCPQQQFDEYTPDAWHELLRDMRFTDCKEAVVDVTKRQPFVSPSEIRQAAKRIRFNRIEEFGPFEPPAELEKYEGHAFSQHYRQWLADMYERIGDGSLTRAQYDTEQAALGGGKREMPALDNVFRRVPKDGAA